MRVVWASVVFALCVYVVDAGHGEVVGGSASTSAWGSGASERLSCTIACWWKCKVMNSLVVEKCMCRRAYKQGKSMAEALTLIEGSTLRGWQGSLPLHSRLTYLQAEIGHKLPIKLHSIPTPHHS